MSYILLDSLNHMSEETCHQLIVTHVQLNYHPNISNTLFVKDCDRFTGTYIVGIQRDGKCKLIKNLISFDASIGSAIIVAGPHGDLIYNCLSTLPQHGLAN